MCVYVCGTGIHTYGRQHAIPTSQLSFHSSFTVTDQSKNIYFSTRWLINTTNIQTWELTSGCCSVVVQRKSVRKPVGSVTNRLHLNVRASSFPLIKPIILPLNNQSVNENRCAYEHDSTYRTRACAHELIFIHTQTPLPISDCHKLKFALSLVGCLN